jgi:hypothetical protein
MIAPEDDAAWKEAYEAACAGACGCEVNDEAEEIRLRYLRNRRVTSEEESAAGPAANGITHP